MTATSPDHEKEKKGTPAESAVEALDTSVLEQAAAERRRWMNDPETIHSMSDVAHTGDETQALPFCLTEGESVIASKATAMSEAHARQNALSTDQLLSHWSGQKAARKGKGPPLQEEIVKRIRREIEAEIAEILQNEYPIGATLVLIGRAFGKDPRQWLPADKISNLFIEAVLYSAGMELPWDFDSIPDYAELKYILGEDRRFTRIFRTDKLRPKESANAFSQCLIEDGDIALWTSPGLRLSGLLEKAEGNRHNILSGGCVDSPTGFLYTTLDFFIETYAQSSPTPDVVYRVKSLEPVGT
ncbi:MAG: hypothetical protein KGS72_19930 [Cyanobacteria bacterium REEB67]|nr:hypothetical protein [Cyanobacteria bacterium REEB67]